MNAAAILVALLLSRGPSTHGQAATIRMDDPKLVYSPYNWYRDGSAYAQSANPGAYLKAGFTGTSLALDLDVSPLTDAKVPPGHFPLVRYSVDGGPSVSVQLSPKMDRIQCAKGIPNGQHSLLFQYVSGYVFLDFWTPTNVVRLAGLELDPGSALVAPFGAAVPMPSNTLFLGDSITNGDDDTADFVHGITNEVDTQDATLGYPAVVAAGIGSEYGIVAYGGASWNRRAADSHTPGLMTSYAMLDSLHSRLTAGKLLPAPDDIFINMGENMGPNPGDVPTLLKALRAAATTTTNIFVIVPFSGRARAALTSGFDAYHAAARSDARTFLIDLGNNPYLPAGRPTMMSVDGQHPLASLHALLGAQLVQARAMKLGLLAGLVRLPLC